MKVHCKNCLSGDEITIPDFTQADIQALLELKKLSPLNTVLHLKEQFKLTLRDAKYITLHINKDYGLCNRCGRQLPEEENTNCPRCGSLNFNWKIN